MFIPTPKRQAIFPEVPFAGAEGYIVRPATAKSYGAGDHQPCPKCTAPMYIARRTPHSTAIGSEMQVFSCMKCDEQINRVVNENGAVTG